MPDNKNFDLLDQIHLASPCHVDWGTMTGDERTPLLQPLPSISVLRNLFGISTSLLGMSG